MALRDGWQLQKRALSIPSLFSLTVTMLPMVSPVRHYLKMKKEFQPDGEDGSLSRFIS